MNKILLDRLRNLTEAQIYNEIYTDTLTGVQNRFALEHCIRPFVAIIDLDSLKAINDEYGHRIGDGYICTLANHLMSTFGKEYVFRLSGDEFVVMLDSAVHLKRGLVTLQREIEIFSFGIGRTLEAADQRLKVNKRIRLESGLRAARGEAPKWKTKIWEVSWHE